MHAIDVMIIFDFHNESVCSGNIPKYIVIQNSNTVRLRWVFNRFTSNFIFNGVIIVFLWYMRELHVHHYSKATKI